MITFNFFRLFQERYLFRYYSVNCIHIKHEYLRLKFVFNFIFFFSIQDYFQWKWWVGGLAMTIVAILGLIGNSISLTILFRKKIRSVAFNQLLAVLCIVDTIFLLCNSLSCGHALGIDNGKNCFYNFPSKHYPLKLSINFRYTC